MSSQVSESETPAPELPPPVFTKARWRSCFFRLAFMWLVSGILFVFVMLFVKSKVQREPEKVQARALEYVRFELLEGFKPYSSNSFWGSNVISYWNMNQMLDDDRSSSVFAIYWEDKWEKWSTEELEKKVAPELDLRLDRNQFRIKKKEVRTLTVDSDEMRIHIYYGVTQIGTTFDEVIACYRFMMGPKGPIQVHTLGLVDTFNADAQIALLSSVHSAATPIEAP